MGKGNMPVSYQSQIFQASNLVLLPGHAKKRASDLVVFGHWRIGDGLGK